MTCWPCGIAAALLAYRLAHQSAYVNENKRKRILMKNEEQTFDRLEVSCSVHLSETYKRSKSAQFANVEARKGEI